MIDWISVKEKFPEDSVVLSREELNDLEYKAYSRGVCFASEKVKEKFYYVFECEYEQSVSGVDTKILFEYIDKTLNEIIDYRQKNKELKNDLL